MISNHLRDRSLKALLMLCLVLFISVVSTSFTTSYRPHKYTLKTIVIDPGHGGSDPGCGTAGVWEKNVALAISLKLGQYLKDSFPDLKVIFTRTTDKFVDLNERA